MNETLYSWTINFHKVVRQQNSGVVEDFILLYSAVYLRIQKWKNYWNRSTFAKIIVKIKVARFLWPTVYNVTVTDIRWRMSANKVEAVELVRWECEPQWDEDPQVTEESWLITLCSFQFHVAYSCEF